MKSIRPLGLNHVASGHAARHGAATALLVLGLAGNVAGGFYYANLSEQRESTREWTARAASPRVAPRALNGAGRVAASESRAELARANDTVRTVNVPWDAVFAALETAGSADVSLLALDPTPEKRTFKLHAEARNMDAALVYLRALAAEPAFSAVILQTHQVQQADPNHPVRILVQVEWRTRS